MSGLLVRIQADSKYPFDRRKLRAALDAKSLASGLGETSEVSVVVVGTRKMSELTKRYLGKDELSDVLSFPQLGDGGEVHGFVTPKDAPIPLGDIVICYPLVMEEAARRGVFVDDLIVERAMHGMKHLMGEEEIR